MLTPRNTSIWNGFLAFMIGAIVYFEYIRWINFLLPFTY